MPGRCWRCRRHARIERIDATEALAIPGVVAVLTAADLPIVTEGNGPRPRAARPERDPVGRPACRAGRRRDAPRPPPMQRRSSRSSRLHPSRRWSTSAGAFAPGAPRARLDATRGGGRDRNGRVAACRGRRPDPSSTRRTSPARTTSWHATAFGAATSRRRSAASDVVVEGRFATSWVHQGYLEPQVATAELDDDGRPPPHQRRRRARSTRARSWLACSVGRWPAVRVTGATLGGAFGGKYLDRRSARRCRDPCPSAGRSASS